VRLDSVPVRDFASREVLKVAHLFALGRIEPIKGFSNPSDAEPSCTHADALAEGCE